MWPELLSGGSENLMKIIKRLQSKVARIILQKEKLKKVFNPGMTEIEVDTLIKMFLKISQSRRNKTNDMQLQTTKNCTHI